jgi:hypothetical protein
MGGKCGRHGTKECYRNLIEKPNLEDGRLDVRSVIILKLFLKERARGDTFRILMARDREK